MPARLGGFTGVTHKQQFFQSFWRGKGRGNSNDAFREYARRYASPRSCFCFSPFCILSTVSCILKVFSFFELDFALHFGYFVWISISDFEIRISYFSFVGAWRSLVAHLLWEQGVGGSNPLAPTSLRSKRIGERRLPRRS